MSAQTLDELIENFGLFSDWEERYRYLIDLGRTLPNLEDAYKVDENLVRGCTSRVWLIPEVNNDVLSFKADSDAHIVRGLVAILAAAYNNKTFDEIRNTDIEAAFKSIGLDTHLSANRRSGFFAMVEKIKTITA